MAQTKIKRFYYRSGQLFLEEPYVGGQYHGTVRTWHKNGKLASQETYRNGLYHGVAKQWDDQGRLLGSFRMDQGTGISCHWHQNGKLLSETSLYRGTFTGLCRSWIGDGTLVSKTWYLDNQKSQTGATRQRAQRTRSFPGSRRMVNDRCATSCWQNVERIWSSSSGSDAVPPADWHWIG